MTTYSNASRELLARVREELAAGDAVQASEKGWGAAAQTVKAVTDARRWRHYGHRFLFDIVKRGVDETGDPELSSLFLEANSVHANFYEDWMPAEMVAKGLDDIQRFVEKMEPLAA
jgi:hypothetical protein